MDKDRILTLVSEQAGLRQYECGSIILAMGCRERPRGAVGIPGSRPAGIFTAGHAQRLINIEGYMPGRTVVVLGSGDIGLIMARRLTLEGAQVEAVAEILPYPSGLVRNVVQCLHDFDIPLLLSHTVAEVHGDRRVEGVTLVQVDDRWTPVPGTERRIDCDTLLLSVGLIPENELPKAAGVAMDSRTGGAYVNDYFETSLQGVFSCGNVLHVNDVVDNVSSEGESAAHGAYLRVKGRMPERTSMVTLQADESIAQIVPHRVAGANDTTLHIRVKKPMGKMTLRVGDGFEKKFPFARPGEMIWVTVPKEIFRDASGPVTVRCEGR
jgi:thioredoxin reductase